MMAPQTIVVGLGNPVLRDDRVGLEIAREVARRTAGQADLRVTEACTGGLDLVETLAGYARAVLIDAIRTDRGEPGTVYRLTEEQAQGTHRCASVHEIDLTTGLRLARRIGLPVPREVMIFAVEVADTSTLGDDMTAAVAAAVPEVATQVVALVVGG
jgi:hydrogenase maturation protease